MNFSASTRLQSRKAAHPFAQVASAPCKNVVSSQVVPFHGAMCSKRKEENCPNILVMNKELIIGTLQCIFFALVCYFIILIFH